MKLEKINIKGIQIFDDNDSQYSYEDEKNFDNDDDDCDDNEIENDKNFDAIIYDKNLSLKNKIKFKWEYIYNAI